MKHLMIGVGLVQIPLLALAATLDGWPMLVVALLHDDGDLRPDPAQRRHRRQVRRRRVPRARAVGALRGLARRGRRWRCR